MYLSTKNIISLHPLTKGQPDLTLKGSKSDIDGIDYGFSFLKGKEDLIS